MSINTNFHSAVGLLHQLTSEIEPSLKEITFGEEGASQHPITTAIKILNKTAEEGTDSEKSQLSDLTSKIIELNKLLKSSSARLKNLMGDKSIEVKGMQVALPQTKFDKMLEIATIIPRIIFTLLIDVLLLPGALVLLLIACCKPNFNPKDSDIKPGSLAFFMNHGSGFNESEFVIARLALQKYGPSFSLNYDGLASNDHAKGIEDYALNKLRPEIIRLKALGINRFVFLGHSMGGMIGAYYAEHFAEADEVKVEHVISVATPWQGTPMVDWFWKLGGRFSKEKETKRHLQMSISGGPETDPKFRQKLVAKALQSEREGKRKYYNIWSSTDYAVPNRCGNLTEDPRRQREFSYLGHYALIAWPSVWFQVRSWLDAVITKGQ